MVLFWVRRYCIVVGLLTGAMGLLALPAKATPGGTAASILVVGDSLSAEYGLQRGSGWVALLEQRLTRERIRASVINASISGDTTSGGKARLGALLALHHPTVVIIELGSNDALRGLALQMTRDNLEFMSRAVQATGAKPLLLGMQMPPNYGQDYAQQFAATFTTVARKTGAGLVPFLLKGVADAPDAQRLFQSDGIHPAQEAHPMMLNNVWDVLKKLIA